MHDRDEDASIDWSEIEDIGVDRFADFWAEGLVRKAMEIDIATKEQCGRKIGIVSFSKWAGASACRAARGHTRTMGFRPSAKISRPKESFGRWLLAYAREQPED